MHALRNIHDALAPDGLLVDTQPLSPHPRVATDGTSLGTLDMREWLETIRAVDELIADTVAAGLYETHHEERFLVTDAFDNGPECLETASGWRETRVPPSLASRLETAQTRVTVEQEVRLRLLRRASRRRLKRRAASTPESRHLPADAANLQLDSRASRIRSSAPSGTSP